MKTFQIYVDGIGFGDVYIVHAKDICSAKAKAKKMAIRDFRQSLRCYKNI